MNTPFNLACEMSLIKKFYIQLINILCQLNYGLNQIDRDSSFKRFLDFNSLLHYGEIVLLIQFRKS
jgi:hypothetical protein